jgi:voltage-gated potassium channel
MVNQRPDYAYQIFILATSIYALAALAFDVLAKPDPETKAIIQYADFAVCLVFLYDFARNLKRAPNRLRYFYTWGWLDLLSSIPMVDALRVGRLARIFRIVRVFRGVRATKAIAGFLVERRTETTLLTTVLVTFVLIVFGSVTILLFEQGPDANIKDAEDALWWAIVTMTTVGYGDRFPVSVEGRGIAALLMVGGVGLFGVFSGAVASWFIQPRQRKEEVDIDGLHREIKALRALIETGIAERKSPSISS